MQGLLYLRPGSLPWNQLKNAFKKFLRVFDGIKTSTFYFLKLLKQILLRLLPRIKHSLDSLFPLISFIIDLFKSKERMRFVDVKLDHFVQSTSE